MHWPVIVFVGLTKYAADLWSMRTTLPVLLFPRSLFPGVGEPEKNTHKYPGMACRECSRSSHSDIPPFRELLQLHSSKSEASVTSCHVKKRSSFLRLLHVWSISGFSNGYEKGLFACFNNKSTRPAPKGSSLLILHLYMTDHVITASHFSNQQHHKMWKFTF